MALTGPGWGRVNVEGTFRVQVEGKRVSGEGFQKMHRGNKLQGVRGAWGPHSVGC